MKRLLIFTYIFLFTPFAMAIEEPAFKVISKTGKLEIRQYAPYLIAQTWVEGDMDDETHMEARRKKGDAAEENEVRNMIRTELRKAKKDMDTEKVEEQAVREAVRKEIRSVLRSRGVTVGGLGFGFKR